MNIKIFKIIACSNNSIEENWSAQLISLLGNKPRRLSRWCELGLFGGLSCIKKAGQLHLPNDVPIRVYSEYSTIRATHTAMAQSREHLPMPFTFMQTQPSQLFNALGSALGWHGDGCTLAGITRQQSEITLLRSIKQSALLAWVDEEPELVSHWIWLEKHEDGIAQNWRTTESIFQTSSNAHWVKIGSDNAIFEAG